MELNFTLSDPIPVRSRSRSEEHTSELQSQSNLVCRLLLEKKTAHSVRPLTHPRTACPTEQLSLARRRAATQHAELRRHMVSNVAIGEPLTSSNHTTSLTNP